MKICCICKIKKEIEAFSMRKDRLNGLGRQSRCRECHKVYRLSHLEQEKEQKRIYRLRNASKINSYHVKYNGTRDNGLYSKWIGMAKRCSSDKDAYSYKDRGIKVLWNNYTEFRNDMYESYLKHLKEYGKKQTSLDRINNDGDYSKENCRWANWTVQNNNKRKYRKNLIIK